MENPCAALFAAKPNQSSSSSSYLQSLQTLKNLQSSMAKIPTVETESEVQFTKQPFIENDNYRKIKHIDFSMFSGDEIRKASECQVWSGSYYDPSRKPIREGLLDSRMGAANKTSTCATCHGSFKECPGHFGYMTLALPVYNIGYLSSIINLLKCICKSCARILIPEKERGDYLRKMRNPRMGALEKSNLAKQILKKCKPTCHRCGYVNGMVKKEGTKLSIIHIRASDSGVINDDCGTALSHTKESKASESKTVVSPVLNPVRVLALFKKMLDEDCEVLYLSDRPEKLMITDISVPPLPIRPSTLVDGGAMSNEDDLTSKMKSIMQVNASLRQDLQCTASRSKCLADWELLQIEVAQYINSDVRGAPQYPNMQPSKPTKGLVQRLKGKAGRFRGNLSGKRVEYTGRTVISPDPNLKITEVGVPILMAQILTYPERVTQHNIEKLRQCVRNGPYKYPGANFLEFPDGTTMSLKYARSRAADELKCGCIVMRHLEDGDIVLFNRQPSLHRMSIMSHRARVMPWRTLRFNESVCNPYNADFDGDEMNMHVPQTEEARTEALTLMGVQNNLCTPKNGEILVASTQDFLTTSFLITRKDTFYDRASFSQMCSYMGDAMDSVDLPSPTIIKPIELWTGKQVFNVLVRPHSDMRVYLNLTMLEKNYTGGETMCPRDGYVYFRNSELISGQLGKATLGNGKKDGLFSVLLRDYNEYAAASCMNRLAKLSARWIGNHGFSIGIDDVKPSGELEFKKDQKITEGYKKCDYYIQLYNKGKIQLQPGCDSAQTLEVEITNVLNEIRETAANVCLKELHWRNSPKIMSECGSKGSPINISQMVACVGQQTVGGKRAPNGFIDRTLPHVPVNSKTPEAKGFVANSFYSGLKPTEFFFHTMAGREGLVDTAVKTAETGYLSRRLVKALEDLSVQYDGTVRNASGGVVQFIYGDDGMDPAKMEGKSGAPLNLERLYMKIKATCPPKAHVELPPSDITEIVNVRLSEHDANLTGGCSEKLKNDIREMIEKVIVSQRNTRRLLDIDEDHINKDDTHVSLERLATSISGITLPQLKCFLDTCIARCWQKKVEGGSAVGVIGAQSIGEPGTQMTLKTFHFAGVASMNITRGVPRIIEIINAAKKISAPIITAALQCDNDARSAGIVKGSIEKTVLGQVAKSIAIEMTPRHAYVIVTLDMESIQASQLSISAESVKTAILLHPKIKLKDQRVDTLDGRKIVITLDADRKKLLFDLHTLNGTLPNIVVQGISNVGRAVINKDKKGKHNLHVEGTNLRAVMGTSGVNANKTTSNHVIEVERTLGIEAARNTIIREIHQTMADYGMTIDMRHMMLLADVMTYKGEVLGIQRYDIQKMKESVLMLASFEKTDEHLFKASYSGRQDNIDGVSECIIMGIPIPIGTGILKVRQKVTDRPDLCNGLNPILV